MDPAHRAQIIRDAALGYHQRRWRVVQVPYAKKAPTHKGWADRQLNEEQLQEAFKTPKNIGVVLGEASGGLMDVDLDCAEAVALAETFLPPTDLIFGRPGKPRSHWLYTCDPPPQSLVLRAAADKAKVIEAETLVELRGNRQQTIVPPSIHEGTGEQIEFYKAGQPARVDDETLRRAVRKLGAASLLVRHWPKSAGGRQHIAMALAGGLLTAGWTVSEVEEFIGAVARVAGDEETAKRATAAEYTARRIQDEETFTGWTRLAESIGTGIVKQVRRFLDLDRGRQATIGTSWQVSRTHDTHDTQDSQIHTDTHDTQTHTDAHRVKDVSVLVGPACEPPLLDASETPRMKAVQADIDARRSSELPLADYIAAAVERNWHRRKVGKVRKAGKGWRQITPLWEFTRDMKGHPALKDMADVEAVNVIEAVLKSWPVLAGSDPWKHFTGVESELAREEIAFSWTQVRFAPGFAPLDAAMERARRQRLHVVHEHRLSDGYVLLLSLGGWLQLLMGDRNIYLPCRAVAKQFGGDTKHESVARWIKMAERHGYLRRVERGHYGEGVHPDHRTADEFRFEVDRFPELKEAFAQRLPAIRRTTTEDDQAAA